MHKTPQELLKLACDAAQNAYAPYSKFRVGACALYDDGSVYTGCNVENASYGLSLCAERNAISNAIADGKHKGLVAIAIQGLDVDELYPCGACRQWIMEFSKEVRIILLGKNGNIIETSIKELLPHCFELEIKNQNE